jgi:hypothetical protein
MLSALSGKSMGAVEPDLPGAAARGAEWPHIAQDARATNTIFETADWLDAVAPSNWDAITIEHEGCIEARLPYVIKSMPGLRVLSVPPLTPWLGPWIAPRPGRYLGRLSHEHDLLCRLIARLPRADAAVIPAAPEHANLLPFYWHGFELRVAYTYRIVLDRSLEEVWRTLKQELRTAIRKAEQSLIVAPSEDVAEVIPLLAGTFHRQGLAVPPISATMFRIMQSSRLRGHRDLLVARDHHGRPHAFALLVGDARHTFYVNGGADPLLRASGAQCLLLWRAIQQSHGRSAVFDFEGSMKAEIERAFRSFGSIQTPHYTALAERTLMGRAYRWFVRRKSRRQR